MVSPAAFINNACRFEYSMAGFQDKVMKIEHDM